MKIDEMRQVAIGAARSILRERGIDPVTADIAVIEAIICDCTLDRQHQGKTFVQWVNRASEHQWNLWRRDWRKWQQKQIKDRVTNEILRSWGDRRRENPRGA